MEKTWEALSADEKQEALFQRWLAPEGVRYSNPAAEKAYIERVTRIKNAIQLKKLPDRVPALLLPSFFPVYHAGFTPREAMYDYDKLVTAYRKCLHEFEPDTHMGAAAPGPGPFYDILDYKLYAWPGHGVAPEQSYQALEGEYMKAEEYDALIQDPSNFFSNIYFPRVFGVLEPFKMLPALTGILEMYGVAYNFIPFALPQVQAAYKALMEAGAEALKWAGVMGAFEKEMAEAGFPQLLAGFTKAPFDVLGDTLRGTRGIMVDIYRRPEKVLKAIDVLTPLMIKMAVGNAQMNGKPIIFMPLHKGADGFLSEEQYKKFYWPSLRKVMLGLIENGCVPFPAAEGGYNSRLHIIRDLPPGKVFWLFDQTDMAKAKEALGGIACFAGNVPSSMLMAGTAGDVEGYVKNLIEVAGKGGGFMVCNGAFFDQAKAENVRAMIETTKKYGAYR